MYMCCTCEFRCLENPEEDVRSPGAEVPGSSELSSVSAGNCSWVLYKKRSMFSALPSHLSSPFTVTLEGSHIVSFPL